MVGVNRYKAGDDRPMETLRVDNSAVRAAQVEKLRRLRAERDGGAVTRTLAALTVAAQSGDGNLLALAIDAARAKATVGEISGALEKAFGRYRTEPTTIRGTYRRELGEADAALGRVTALVREFKKRDGGPPRILVAKVGQDGHDRGQKVIASAFADLGFEVEMGPLFQSPEDAARLAIEKDVHMVGVSTLAAGHLTLVPALKRALEAGGRPDIMVVVGGIVPEQDWNALYDAGVAAIFTPGTVIRRRPKSSSATSTGGSATRGATGQISRVSRGLCQNGTKIPAWILSERGASSCVFREIRPWIDAHFWPAPLGLRSRRRR